MAAVTFECPVDPSGCAPSATGGFCQVHRGTRLERVRPRPAAAEPPPAAGPGAEAGPDPDQGAGPVSGAASDGAAEQGPAGQLAVRILGQLLTVPPGGLLLGREAPATRELPGFADLLHVGRQHARLYWHGDALHVVDLSSRNSTFLAGRLVTEPTPLRAGQVLDLGGDVDVLVVELDEFGLAR
jgi:FHA domain